MWDADADGEYSAGRSGYGDFGGYGRRQGLLAHDPDEERGGVLSWIWWVIKGFFIYIIGGAIVGALALALLAIVAALVLSPLAGPIFALYLFIDIQAPWMISALMSAGLPYSLALFVILLHTLGFAAILFTAISVVIRAVIDSHAEGSAADVPGVFAKKLKNFFMRRKEARALLGGVAIVNFVLSGFGLVGAGVGIYLSVVIIPSVITAIAATTGVSIVWATIAGVFMAFDLIALTGMFFMAPTWLGWRFVATPGFKDIQENPMQILALVGMLSGLAFGGYLASLVYPILFSALAGLGLPQATVVLAALIITFEVIFATSFLVFMGATGFTNLFSFTLGSSKNENPDFGQIPVGGNQHQQDRVRSLDLLADRGANSSQVHARGREEGQRPAHSSDDMGDGFKPFAGKGYTLVD